VIFGSTFHVAHRRWHVPEAQVQKVRLFAEQSPAQMRVSYNKPEQDEMHLQLIFSYIFFNFFCLTPDNFILFFVFSAVLKYDF